MKLVHRSIDKNNEGFVVAIAEESEDMWHAYNLIAEGDYNMCIFLVKHC